MKMNCLSRFLTSSKNKNSSNDSSLAVATKQKSNNSFGRAQNIYKYYNSLVSPKTSPSSANILNFNNNNNSYSNKSMVMSGSGDRGSFYPSPSVHSPGMETLSSPTLTSTPAAADSLKLLDGYIKMRSLDVCFMPDVVLDKIFSKLTDEDIRRVYQVSRPWRNAVLKRPSVNRRREEFVEKIRQNKENIIKGKQDLVQTDVNKARRDRICDVSNNSSGKPGSRLVLNDCGNQMTLSFTSTNNSSHANRSNGFSPINSSTPTSRFSTSQRYEEWQQAERNLKEGQRLFRCKKCYGPVASPVASKKEEVSNNETGISIAKCRLTARMSSIEDNNNMKPTRERKKQRSLVKSSPASFPSTYVDICSLGEIVKRLNISHSTPEVASRGKITLKEESMKKANSSPAILSSSNTGIDLPISMNNNNSGSLRCNVSKFNFNFSCSTESIVFNSPSTAITTNLNNNNRTISPKTYNDITSNSIASDSQALSQNLSDSGFSMSYINSDDDFNESHLSTIFTPEPVKKSVEESPSPMVLNRSEDMQFDSTDTLLRQAVCNNLKNSLSVNVQAHSTSEGHNSNSVYDIIPNINSVNEFRVPAELNDVSNVNRSLDPMLDSHQSGNISDISRSMKTSSYSVLRDTSRNRSSLIQSPAFRYNNGNSIVSESPIVSTSLFPKAAFGVSQPSPLGLSGNAINTSGNLNDSIILECPDCSFRFCSVCEESEHIGKPCRVIDSDSFRNESNDEPLVVKSPYNNSGPNSSMSSKGKGSAKDESKKRLRRIARK